MARDKDTTALCTVNIGCDGNIIRDGAAMCGQCRKAIEKRVKRGALPASALESKKHGPKQV